MTNVAISLAYQQTLDISSVFLPKGVASWVFRYDGNTSKFAVKIKK
jgi:hypothetical protein